MSDDYLEQAMDSLASLVSGLGARGSKVASDSYIQTFAPLTREQLDSMYRDSWLARKAVDVPAFDSIREWRTWQAEDDEVEAISAEETRLDLPSRVLQALTLARLHGGALLIFHVRGQDPATPLDLDRVGEGDLMFVRAVSRCDLSEGETVRDFEDPLFGLPSRYTIVTASSSETVIDASRVARFVPRPIPMLDRESKWGDSVLDGFRDPHNQAIAATQATSAILQDSQVDVVKMPEFVENVASADYRKAVQERFAMLSVMKGITKTLVLDAQDEWDRIETNMAALADVVNSFLLVASGAADIPATRMLGQSPAGLSATGESDLRNYYDAIGAYQKVELTPSLRPLDAVLVRSALGAVEEEPEHGWNPLWQMSGKDKAERDFKSAQAFNVDVTSGVFSAELLQAARVSQLLEQGTYPGLREAMKNEPPPEDDAINIPEGDPEVKAAFAGRSGGGQ